MEEPRESEIEPTPQPGATKFDNFLDGFIDIVKFIFGIFVLIMFAIIIFAVIKWAFNFIF